MTLTHSRSLVALISILFLQLSVADPDIPDPVDQVRFGTQQVIKIVKDKSLSEAQRYAMIRQLVDEHFDFRAMSQSILAIHWQKASPVERERFIDYFTRHLQDKYMAAAMASSDIQIRYKEGKIHGQRAAVATLIKSGAVEIPVTYKLKLTEGKWLAYDVNIEGISLINNYRQIYSAILDSEGIKGVLTSLQLKAGENIK